MATSESQAESRRTRAVNRGGRPRLPGHARYIRLRSSVFDLWRQRKRDLGFKEKTDSIFAEFLLHQPSGRNVTILDQFHDAPGPNLEVETESRDQQEGVPPFFSTPIRPGRPLPWPREQDTSSSNSNVDVTGCTMSTTLQEANPSHNTIRGNPFSLLNPADQEDHCSSASDEEEDVSYYPRNDIDDSDDCGIGEMICSIIDVMCVESDDDSSDEESCGSADDVGLFRSDEDIIVDKPTEMENTVMSVGSDLLPVTSVCDEETVSVMEDDLLPAEADIEDTRKADQLVTEYHSQTDSSQQESVTHAEIRVTSSDKGNDQGEPSLRAESNREQILKALEGDFKSLTSIKGLEDLVELQSKLRVVVSIDKLLELAGKKCTIMHNGQLCGCDLTHSAHPHSSCVEVRWVCKNKHYGKWESSEVLTKNRNSNIYLNDCLMAIAVIISGNSYAKFLLLCKALNLKVIGHTMFFNFQKNCALPVIKDVWSKMNVIIIEILSKYKDVCIAGDGRNDSPGHSARYSVYTIMEHATKVVVDLEVLDKRETGGNSTAMEKEGLRRLIERLMHQLNLGEMVTDASSTIIKLIRDMKEQHELLLELFHSLDIWHKSKKIGKGLHQAAKVKGCEELKEWIDPIINHFWYCCQMAEGSADELKDLWQGVLHHVCGEHSWVESECKHGTHVESESDKKHLSKTSKPMAALRKIVLDDKWLKSLHFYVRFRHTGDLENFNSMMLKYAPKRSAFEYPYFIMRILLAAIDHNLHLFREPKKGKNGEVLLHRKYSKRTQKYHAEIVKEDKAYTYFPYLASRMLQARKDFEGSFARSEVRGFDPKQIAPTIGMIAPPPTAELRTAPSRFDMKKAD